MRRFKLNFTLLTSGLVVTAACAGGAFGCGMTAPGLLLLLAAVVLAGGLWSLVRRLISVMVSFSRALEMGDASMKLNVGADDRELREMSESANRVMSRFRSNCLELETRKHYYDRILNVMTHEMRNAITPVIALSADMSANPDRYGRSELVDALDIIHTESRGIKRFLDAYYELTHLPAPKLEEIRATDFAARIRTLMAHETARRGLPEEVLSFRVGQAMTLMIDSSLMRQAIGNLIRNSLDAIDGLEHGHVTVTISASDGQPFIAVEDNGCGIGEEAVPHLFQPFFTTKSKGSGIGLFLSRQIARLHGGDLRIASLPGKGTSAYLMVAASDGLTESSVDKNELI